MASSETPFRLDGETALITGGGTGLGLAIADCFVRSGARVILTGRTEDVLREAVGKLGPAADYRVHDVAEDDRVPALLESLDSPPSILVNNAGIHLKKPAALTTGEEFAEVLRVHVLGSFAFTRHLIPSMQSRGSGSILFIASMASIIGLPETVAYSAAKSAYAGMTRSLASELGGSGIRVNAIAPGWIETPMLERALQNDPARKTNILARTPLGGFGKSDDIGWTAVFLCSTAARFVTGALLPVDGGASIGF